MHRDAMCSCDNTSPLKEGKSSRNIKFDSRLDHTTSSLMFPEAFRPRGTVTFPFPRWWLHRAGMRFFRAALRFGQSPSSRVELGWKDNCKRQRGSSANLPADVNTPLWRGPNVSNLTVNGKLKKKITRFFAKPRRSNPFYGLLWFMLHDGSSPSLERPCELMNGRTSESSGCCRANFSFVSWERELCERVQLGNGIPLRFHFRNVL